MTLRPRRKGVVQLVGSLPGGRRSGWVRPARLLGHADPVALIGIALSVTLSIVLDVSGAASGVESLLAGMLGTTIALLIDLSARTERRFQLRTMLESAPWLRGALVPIIAATREVAERFPDSPVEVAARRRYALLAQELDELRRGRVVRGRDDDTDLLAGARACRSRLEAMTIVVGAESRGSPHWWAAAIGRRYWQANLEALARGVQITRIVAYAQWTPELSELVERQRAAGVRIALLPRDAVDPDLQTNFAIFDRSSAWEARMNPHGEIIANVLSLNPQDLDRLDAAFTAGLAAAATDR